MLRRSSPAESSILEFIGLQQHPTLEPSHRRTRIIYAWNYIEWGGAQIHFLALIKEARRYFDVVVVLPIGTDDQFLGFLKVEGIRHELFMGNVDLAPKSSVTSKIGRHWNRLKSEYAMLKKIRQIGLENAVVHTDIMPGQSLFSLAWLAARAPVFLTLHNAMPVVQKWRFAIWKLKFGLISRFDNLHVFCTNRHAAEYFRTLFSGRVAEDIKITYDSIDPVEIEKVRTAGFDRNIELSRFGIPTDKFIVLAVGQFVDRKGRWTFLEAARIINEKTRDIHFVWISPNRPNANEQKQIDSFKLGETLHMLLSEDVGKDRESVLKFFRIADVFALPSYIEGVPISLLEAMSLGIPSISTNVYGIPEAIINEKTGLMIEPGRAQDLAAAVLRLFHDAGLRERLANAGRQHAVANFDEREAASIAVSEYVAAAAANQLRQASQRQ